MFNVKKLRKWMVENNYTLQKLSGDTGINVTTLHRILKGKSIPRLNVVEAIQQATKIPMSILVENKAGRGVYGKRRVFGKGIE